MEKKILKNTSWLWGSQIVTKIIAFFYTVYLAKTLGVNNFGYYVVALSYFALISSIADFGINRFFIREISKNSQSVSYYLSSVFFLRIGLVGLFLILFSSVYYLFDPDALRRDIVLIAVFAVLPQSISLTLDSIFIALLKVKYSAIASALFSAFNVIAGVFLLSLGVGLYGVVVALVIGQVFHALMLFVFCIKEKVNWISIFKAERVLEIIKGSYAYGLLGFIGLVSFKVDTLILSYYRGSFETGIYGAAYKFLEASSFVPTALAIALFPVLARLHKNNNNKIRDLYFKSIKTMFLVGLIFMSSYIIILPWIINWFLPGYKASIGVLTILSFAIPFMFIHVPSGQVLLSTDKYLKHLIIIYLALLVTNVLLYLVFIPHYGYWGAAGVTVVSEVFTFSTFFLFLKAKVLR